MVEFRQFFIRYGGVPLLKMSSIDNMGTACLIWLKPWRGAPPTRRVGESGSDSSGWAFPIFPAPGTGRHIPRRKSPVPPVRNTDGCGGAVRNANSLCGGERGPPRFRGGRCRHFPAPPRPGVPFHLLPAVKAVCRLPGKKVFLHRKMSGENGYLLSLMTEQGVLECS